MELNATGAEILALCDGNHSALDVAERLRARHPESEQVWDDTHEFLLEMSRLGVIQTATTNGVPE